MVCFWMEGTLVLVAVAFVAALIVVSITAAAVVVIAAVVSTVAGVVTSTVVAAASGRASEIGQNLHEVDEFLSGCSRCELLGVSNERGLIVRTLTAKEGFLTVNVLFSRQRIWTRHHRGVLDERIESKKESSRLDMSWNMSATRSNVGDEGRSVHIGADRGCDACLDRVVLSLIDWSGCWQTEDCLLINLVIVGVENRLKIRSLVTERHAQSVGIGLKGSETKEVGFG
jgi:hypothetical protein